jgi:hypothetical protein
VQPLRGGQPGETALIKTASAPAVSYVSVSLDMARALTIAAGNEGSVDLILSIDSSPSQASKTV